MPPHGLYVTGTDTGIGKTVASGCEATANGWRNEDALALLTASDPQPAYAALNPYALPLPLAPELAARDAGVRIDLPRILQAHARLRGLAAQVVVEGVGGWAAPLSATLTQAELVSALGIPVVLVVGLRLGCLNHAILSDRAIIADGCELLGWIGNAVDPDMQRRDDHRAMLDARLPAPCLGWLPHQATADAPRLSRYLVLPS